MLNNSGTLSMYSLDDGTFIKPDSNKDYLPTNDFKITNWNTWVRAFCYYMRDLFGFKIETGPGTSLGLIYGCANNITVVRNNGFDNDWTNEDYGRISVDNENWINYRAPSPFKPTLEDGVLYYGEEQPNGDYLWTGQWDNCHDEIGFDDTNNRFDILLTSEDYDNLGLRLKYPITTTGTTVVSNTTGTATSADRNSGISNITMIYPGVVPINDKQQVAKLFNTNYSYLASNYQIETSNLDNYATHGLAYAGFITFINNSRNNFAYINQRYYENGSTKQFCHQGLTLNNNQDFYSTDFYGWTPNFLKMVSRNKGDFARHFPFNKIQYTKSYDNKTLLISVTDGRTIGLQFCLYKKNNNNSGLILAEDFKHKKLINSYWYKSQDYDYDHLIQYNNGNVDKNSVSAVTTGNLGNIIIGSDNSYKITPIKYFKDIYSPTYEFKTNPYSGAGNYSFFGITNPEERDLTNGEGVWRIERFDDQLNNSPCSSLYLITDVGTKDATDLNGKILCTKINNKTVKFIVTTFNGATNETTNRDDNFYLIAIPIELEE